ncbi:MAG: hypothetical protein ACT4QD_04005 [Acidobacteriota bacterium]
MTEHPQADLAQLFNRHGSDKDLGGYTPVYHALLSSRQLEPLHILEIGIGTMVPDAHSSMASYALEGYRPGGSLRAWRDYFPNASIHGIDVQPDTQFHEPRITTHLCDSTDARQVEALFERLNGLRFDIIIDDGSHVDSNQLATLRLFYQRLTEGGLYFIEDLDPNCMLNTTPALIEEACHGSPFFYAGLHSSLCVVFNRPLVRGSGCGY